MYRKIKKTVGCSILALLAAQPLAAHAEPPKAELLGVPIKSVVFGNSQGVFAKGPNGQADTTLTGREGFRIAAPRPLC